MLGPLGGELEQSVSIEGLELIACDDGMLHLKIQDINNEPLINS